MVPYHSSGKVTKTARADQTKVRPNVNKTNTKSYISESNHLRIFWNDADSQTLWIAPPSSSAAAHFVSLVPALLSMLSSLSSLTIELNNNSEQRPCHSLSLLPKKSLHSEFSRSHFLKTQAE